MFLFEQFFPYLRSLQVEVKKLKITLKNWWKFANFCRIIWNIVLVLETKVIYFLILHNFGLLQNLSKMKIRRDMYLRKHAVNAGKNVIAP